MGPQPQPTVRRLTLQATEREPTPQLQLTEEKLTVDVATPQPQPTVRRLTLQATVREATLQPQLTEEKLTHQLQPTEVRLTEVRVTLQATEREATLQPLHTVVKLTEVTPTEERTTEVNHTDTKHEVQTDYFAVLFQDHQTSQKNFKIDYCIFIFICVFDTFNKLH